MKAILIIILIGAHIICNAQSKLGNEWITGSGGQRVIFKNGTITTNNNHFIFSYFDSGNSNICDTDGNLILASDGFTIYDSLGNVIDGGDTLVPKQFFIKEYGRSIFSQSSIFLPIDSGKYYFITPTQSDVGYSSCYVNITGCYFDLLLYNIIDMNANGGAGKVVKRMQPLMENIRLSQTQMMACRHANGKDWWLLKQGADSNNVYKFLFTKDSIYNYGRQEFASPNWAYDDQRGQSMFSQDGTQYASTTRGNFDGQVFIANFDRCTGMLSNPKTISIPWASKNNPNDTAQIDRTTKGLAFSPNGKLLYVATDYNMWQYDLQAETLYKVASLDTSWQRFVRYTVIYLGPDDKLYIGNDAGISKQMSRIDNPDVKGAGCNFCPRCLRLDTLSSTQGNFSAGTPPCMPNYSLGAKPCWPLDTPVVNVGSEMVVYPNPSSAKFQIKCKNPKSKKELYNAIGQLIISTKENEIDVSALPKGLYFIKCEDEVKKVVVE
jgi:hypothetical protein